MLTNLELEELANHLLSKDLKDRRKNKSQITEYPILSPSQLKRRHSMEIPYSNLSDKQKLDCRTKNLECDLKEDE